MAAVNQHVAYSLQICLWELEYNGSYRHINKLSAAEIPRRPVEIFVSLSWPFFF